MFSAVNPMIRMAMGAVGRSAASPRSLALGAATSGSTNPTWTGGDLGPSVWNTHNSPEAAMESLNNLPPWIRDEMKQQRQQPTAASSTQFGEPPQQSFADKMSGMFRGNMPFGGAPDGMSQGLPSFMGGPSVPGQFPGEQTPAQRVDGGHSMFEMPPSQRVAEGHGAFPQPGMPLDIKPPQQMQAAPQQMQGPDPQMQGPPQTQGPPGISPMWLQRDHETGAYLDPRMAALAEKQHPGPFAGLFG